MAACLPDVPSKMLAPGKAQLARWEAGAPELLVFLLLAGFGAVPALGAALSV